MIPAGRKLAPWHRRGPHSRVQFNARYSDAIAEAILPHTGCVIGSRFAISDVAAIAFARGSAGVKLMFQKSVRPTSKEISGEWPSMP